MEVIDYSRLIKKAANTLNLSKTDIEILKTFVEGKKLLVSDITNHIKRSERHLRQRLSVLVEKGFLKKNIEVLENKRLAYRYSLKPIESIVNEIKNNLFKKINEFEDLVI